jgi:2-polyprenyl-3-methyl-5-hydroxy-6-metoxy-1,4-benzoquinol methylase
VVDELREADIEAMTLPWEPGSIDVILCLDVLEHLRDPWSVADKLRTLLKPGGALIASVPNARHCKVIVPLVLRGRWDYMPAGLLDRTHLRFFTRATARELLAGAGLHVTDVRAVGMPRFSRWWWLDRATLTMLRQFFAMQYLLRGERDDGDRTS